MLPVRAPYSQSICIAVFGVFVMIAPIRASASVHDSATALDGDRVSIPASPRTFSSADGRFELIVTTSGNGKARGELRDVRRDTRMWNVVLPQELGPRFAFVDAAGYVWLVDATINVLPRDAVLVLRPNGTFLPPVRLDQLVEAARTNRASVAASARHGGWIAGIAFRHGELCVTLGQGTVAVRRSGDDLVIVPKNGKTQQ